MLPHISHFSLRHLRRLRGVRRLWLPLPAGSKGQGRRWANPSTSQAKLASGCLRRVVKTETPGPFDPGAGLDLLLKWSSLLTDRNGERRGQVADRRIGVARREWLKTEAFLDQFQDRYRLVLRMVDIARAHEGRDDDSRDARAVSPAIEHRRRDVIPASSVFVVGNNDCAIFPRFSLLHGGDKVRHMLLPLEQGSVAWMFIVRPKRLDEANGGQSTVRRVGKELSFVLQTRRRPKVLRINGAIRIVRRVLAIVGKRLVMELEERIGISIDRIGPAAGIPSPGNVRAIEAVADGGCIIALRWVRVVYDVEKIGRQNTHRMRCLCPVSGVDCVFAVDCEITIHQSQGRRVVARLESGRDRLFPERRRRGGQKLMIQERAAIGGMEEVITERVELR